MRSPAARPWSTRAWPSAMRPTLQVTQLRPGVGCHHVGEEAVGTTLDRGVGNHHDVPDSAHHQACRHRQARPERVVLVREARFQLDGAAGHVHLVVDELQRAFAQPLLAVGAERSHLEGASLQAVIDVGELLLGRGEDDGDRLHLSDGEDACLVAGVHDVAGIDLAEAGAARERRADGSVGELHLGALDGGLVGLEQGGEIGDVGGALIQDLLRGNALLCERDRALQILLGVVEVGLVLGQLGGCLIEGCLERRRVDLHQEVPLLEHLPFLKADLDDLSVHARAHCDGVHRLHGAEAREHDGEVLPLHDGDSHGSRRRLG